MSEAFGGMRVELLGTVRALRDDVELDLGSAHRRAVLSVLAMSTGHVVSRAELIDALWGEHPPASANGSIYTYVSSLRRALDPDRSGVLASRGSGYALLLPPDAVDARAFDLYRERAQARHDSGTERHRSARRTARPASRVAPHGGARPRTRAAARRLRRARPARERGGVAPRAHRGGLG